MFLLIGVKATGVKTKGMWFRFKQPLGEGVLCDELKQQLQRRLEQNTM